MRQPITFVHRNLVFGPRRDEAWALYRLAMRSYAHQPATEKHELFDALAAYAWSVGADFSLLRVTRPWSVEAYLAAAELCLDARHGDPEGWRAFLEAQRPMLEAHDAECPEAYLAVRLTAPSGLAAGDGGDPLGRRIAEALGLGDPRAIGARRMEALTGQERRAFELVFDHLDCERATTLDIQRLIVRALRRGLGEVALDERFAPQALVLGESGEAVSYLPLEADLLRLFADPIELHGRTLRVDTELGESHQALVALGALPERAFFPGRSAELLFAPLEELDFPVDACLAARFIPNDKAVALARRKVMDADHIHAEESHGPHGPTANSHERPYAARELEGYLTSESRPPLLRASISFAVAGRTERECEARVERLRRAYAPLALHRPYGHDQLRLFTQHLPGQPTQLGDYDQILTVEQLGAMVPTATHAVGSQTGPYIGHTVSGSRQPVLFDLTEASMTDRPPTILMVGTLGSGKTIALELFSYAALLAGSRVIDIDPRGDHRLHELPELADRAELIELGGGEDQRGLLDPFRIAGERSVEQIAATFFTDCLPDPPGEWRTEIRRAIRAVLERPAPGRCALAVIEELRGGTPEARAAGEALAVYAEVGVARLGFGRPGEHRSRLGERRLTSVRTRGLDLPRYWRPREKLRESERVSQAVFGLLAAASMEIARADGAEHVVVNFEEGWYFLEGGDGQWLIEQHARSARSDFVTVVLASQTIGEQSDLENLVGARFCFGMEQVHEARRGLALVRLDPADERLSSALLSYRHGRGYLRDFENRTAEIQIVVPPRLLAALHTRPPERNSIRARGDDTRELEGPIDVGEPSRAGALALASDGPGGR